MGGYVEVVAVVAMDLDLRLRTGATGRRRAAFDVWVATRCMTAPIRRGAVVLPRRAGSQEAERQEAIQRIHV